MLSPCGKGIGTRGDAVKGWGPMKSERKIWFGTAARGFVLAVIVAGAVALGPFLKAEDSGTPGRAVRLSNVEGQVQLSQGNMVLAAQALANTPLFEGTQITTSDDGRAEIQFEDGSVARISPNSSLTLGVLRQQGNSNETEMVLDSGLAYFELQGGASPIKVRFDGSEVSGSGFTVLRVNLDNPPGELSVFSGNAHLEGGNNLALDLHGGESVKLNSVDAGNYVLSEAIEPNSWDAWNSDRDQALTSQEADRTAATNSVPNLNNPAWSDLDANGNWYNVPGQGYVWSPYEAESAGWDPYGCGSWVFTRGFGYVWVSCESWGYMPYASGAWSYYDGFGWGWAPGFGGPWWAGGGWFLNVNNPPFRYRPPNRPRGIPVRPGSGSPIRAGGRYEPYPVVAVNRMRDTGSGPTVRARNAPVELAGNPVQPLKPLAPRQVYNSGSLGGVNRPLGYVGTGGGVRYGYASTPNAGVSGRPNTWYTPRAYSGQAPSRPSTYSPSYTPRASAPSRSYSAPSAPAASHPSGGGGYSGGGGGGAARGGGGGGSHH